MVRIRMQRLGRRHRPFFRINAIDQRTRRNGRVIEPLGWFDPLATEEGKIMELKGERIQYWLEQGAQPSETVEDLLAKNDLLPAKMKAAWEKRRADDNARVATRLAEKAALKKAEDDAAAAASAAAEAQAKAAAEAKAAEEAASEE